MAVVRYAAAAEEDLLQIWVTIAADNPPAANRVLEEIDRYARVLADQPLMGRARPELAVEVRSLPTSTPYILFYLPQPDGIVVVRVLHHARDLQDVIHP